MLSIVASDCQDILQHGFQNSGVYIIRPRGTGKNIFVYCDMNSAGDGWTVCTLYAILLTRMLC